MQMKLIKIVKKIVILLAIILILMPQVVSNAALTESQQAAVVTFCENMATKGILYDHAAIAGNTYKSDLGYRGLCADDGNMYMVCATYVSYVLKELFGIELAGYNSTDAYFADASNEYGCTTTSHNMANKAESHFEFVIDGTLQVGDIIIWRTGQKWIHGHIGIYLGNDRVTHCGTSTGVTITSLSNMETWAIRHCVLRISEDVELGTITEIKAEILNGIRNWKYRKVNFRKANESDIDKNKEFEYQGIAKLESQTSSKTNVTPGESLGVYEITAYCSCASCCGDKPESERGITSTGRKAQANHTVAVNTELIPYDTVLIINGKTYVAEDTGGAMYEKNDDGSYKKIIDVYFDDHQEARNFGRQSAEVFVGESTGNSTSSTKEENDSTTEWRFPTLSSILDWILGLITYIIKGVFVGTTTIVHVLVSYYVDAATGENVADRLNNGMMEYLSSGKMREDLEKSISLEKIVYNKVPMLDANIFNGNTAGGKTVDSGSLTMVIRNVVSGLYVGIRQLAMIAMLLILIYLGIKLVTSSIGEQKAEYRKKLTSWAIAFLIVFGMHYFLIGVMKINEIAVGLLSNIGSNFASKTTDGQYTDLALAMRDLTYNSAITQSFLAAVMYMILVYYLIKFIVIYFKRLFVVAILIILGPILAIKNAVDRVRFNKSTSMATWAKEYIFSVGTQTIHAIIFTIFMSITYTMVLKTDEAKIALCILATLFFRFMTSAEKMLRKMMRLVGSQTESIIGDTDSTDARDLFGFAVITKINQTANMLGIKKSIAKGYQANKEFFNKYLEAEYVKVKRDEYIKKYKDVYMTDERGRRVKVESNIDEKIDNILREEYKYKINKAVSSIKMGADTIKSVTKIGVGTVILSVGTQKDSLLIGSLSLATGVKTLGIVLGKPIKGYRTTEKTIRYRTKNRTYKDIKRWASSNGTVEVAKRLKQKYVYNKDDVTAGNELKVLTLHQARKVELELEEEIADKKETVLKGTEPNASPIEKKLAEDYKKDLKRSVHDTMKTVDRKDIHKEVKDYMKKNNKYSLTLEDCENIAGKFHVKLAGEIVSDKIEKDEFVENVKSETMARFIKEVTINDGIAKDITLDEEAMQKVEDNLKAKLADNSNENTKIKQKEKKDILNAIKCVENKRHELKDRDKLHVFSNLNQEDQRGVNVQLINAIDDSVVEKQVPKLNREQLVDTIKKAVNMEGSIKRHKTIKEFDPIVKKVEQIRELDEISRASNIGPIYENVENLVESMINNTKITNRKN